MLGDDAEFDAAQRWVDGWQAGIEERAARARTLSGRLAELTATARSRDGLVEVTVASSGAVTGLRLDEAIRAQSAARTAEQILASIGAAQARLAEQASEATVDVLGADDPAAEAIVASYTQRFGRPDDEDGTDAGR